MSGDKPASILTESQRKYLKGNNEPSNPREYDRRIRNRIEAAMSDFALMFQHMDQKEVRKCFGTNSAHRIEPQHEANGEVPQDPDTAPNSFFAIAFLLRGLNYGNEPISPELEDIGKEQPAFSHFIEQIEFGVKHYLKNEKNYLANPSVSIKLNDLSHTDDFLSDLPDSDD